MPSYNGGPYYRPKAEVTKIVDGSAVTNITLEQENEGLRINFNKENGTEAFSAHIPAYSGSGSGLVGNTFGKRVESMNSVINAHTLDESMHISTAERELINSIDPSSITDASNHTTSVNRSYNATADSNNNVLSSTQKISEGFSIINSMFKRMLNHINNSNIHMPSSTLASYCTNDKYNALNSTVSGHTTSINSLNSTVGGLNTLTVEKKATSKGKALTWNVAWGNKKYAYKSGDTASWTVCTTSIPFTGIALDSFLPYTNDGYFFVSNSGGYINWFQDAAYKSTKWYAYPYTFKEKPIVTVTARCTNDLTQSPYNSYTASGKALYWGLPIEAKILSDGTTEYLPSIVAGTYNKLPYEKRTSMTFSFVLDIMVQGWT